MAYKIFKERLKNGNTVELVSWEGVVPPNHSSTIAGRPWLGTEPRSSFSFYDATNEYMRNDWASLNMQPQSFTFPSASGQNAATVMLYHHAESNTWHTSDALDIDHIVQWRDYFGQLGVANHAEANMAYNDVHNLRMLPSVINRARDSADRILAIFGADSREWRTWVDNHFAFDPTKNHPDFDPDLDWAGRTAATQDKHWVPEDGRVGLRFDTKVLGKWFEAELQKSYVRSVTVTNAAGQTQEVPLFRCAASGQLVTRDALDIDHHVPFDVLSKKIVEDAAGRAVSVAEMLDAYNDVSNLRLVSRSVNSSHEFEVDAHNEFPDEEMPEIPGEFDDFIDDSPQLGVAPRLVTGVDVEEWATAQVGTSYADSDSRYGRQIIIQLENDPAAAEAAARLAAKHPGTSVIVQLDELGNYRVVYGDMAALARGDAPMRWQIVGHGRSDANGRRTLGGMGAANLAQHLTAFHAKLTETIQKPIGTPARISLVGCTLERNGEQEGFGHRFASALKSPLIEVSIHTSDLAIDREGRKWPTSASGEIASVVDDNKVVYRWRWEGGVVQTREQSKRIVLIGPDRINVEELVEDIRASNRPLSQLNAAEREALSRFYPNAMGAGLDETGLLTALASPVEYAKLLDVIERIGTVHLGLPNTVGLGDRALVNAEDAPAYRAAARQQLASRGTVRIDGADISLALLFDLGATFDGRPLTPELATTLGAEVSGKKIAFDPVRLVSTMAEVPTQAELEALASIVKRQLSGNGGNIAMLLRDGPLTDARAGDLLETLKNSVPSALEVTVADRIKGWYGDSASVRANWLSMAQGLDPAQRQLVQKLYIEASEASGFDVAEFKKISTANPGLSQIEILQRMAMDAAERRVRYDSDASAAMKIAAWTEQDAGQFLIHSKLATRSEIGGINIDVARMNQFIDSASAMDRIRITAAMLKLSGEAYRTLRGQVEGTGTQASKEFFSKLDSERTVLSNHGGEIAVSRAGHALNAFVTLNSVRQLVGDWNRMSASDKSLGLAMTVGGVAMSPLSTGIAKALGQFGKALNAVDRFGQAARVVEAGILDLALAPATFAAIGLQWKSFWANSGDTQSFEYKSLVANTVMTTVTTAVGLALTGVSIAASLSTVVAGSVLGTIAASAGPIGVAIAAAGFIINGIVQGALVVAEYDEYFANTSAKVEAFFAAWIGVETDGVKRAREEKAAQEDATRLQQSLNSEWEQLKSYLSDLFSKDGYKTLNYREREHQVKHGTIKAQNGEFTHVLQDRPEYRAIGSVVSSRVADGGGVWADLGNGGANYEAVGVESKRNLFNLSGATLKSAKGGNEADAFNLDAATNIGTIDGSGGHDTLVLDAGGLSVYLKTFDMATRLAYKGRTVVLDQVTESGNLAAEVSDVTQPVDRVVDVRGVEAYVISNAGEKSLIEGAAGDEFFDISGTDVAIAGGDGNNTYALNQGNRITSTSNDIVLWNGKVDATVSLRGVKDKASQTLLIDLPADYRDIRMRRVGNDLQLSYETEVRSLNQLAIALPSSVQTRTLTVSGLYGMDGGLDASKGIRLRDPHGNDFAPTSLGLIDDQWRSLSAVAKSFVFATTTDTEPRKLVNDAASSTYSLKAGSGRFVAEAHTTQSMQFVLEANLEDLYYSVCRGTLTIISAPGKPKLELQIPGYAEAVKAGVVSVWLVPPRTAGQQSIIGVELPPTTVDAIGQLKAISNPLVQARTDAQLTAAAQPAYAHVYDAAKEHSIWLEAVGDLPYTQLRIGNDLVLYQGEFSSPEKIRIVGYFDGSKPFINVKRNGETSSLVLNTTKYVGDAYGNDMIATNETELAGLDGVDVYHISAGRPDISRWVVDNMATDMRVDTLDLGAISSARVRALRRAGDDMEIVMSFVNPNDNTPYEQTVVLRNYVIDPRARHLQLKVDGVVFALPLVDADTGYFLYEAGSTALVAGDGVHQLRVPRTGALHLYIAGGPPSANYRLTVEGYDLKLVKNGQTIYLRDYYRNPGSVHFVSSQTGSHDEGSAQPILVPEDFAPDAQALFKKHNVPRDKWVPYILNEVDSEAELRSLAALAGEGELATDFNVLPDQQDFSVYLQAWPNSGSGERVLFATGQSGKNGFKFYLDGQNYLCYKAYVNMSGWEGVEVTLYSQSARIYEVGPIARARDTEFVLRFSGGNTLDVIASGPNGPMATNNIRLDPAGASPYYFSVTRGLNGALLNHANLVRKVMPGSASASEVSSILETDGRTWAIPNAQAATDLKELPDSQGFTVYLSGPSNPGDSERVLFATGGVGRNGFKFYLDKDGYLCYQAYVTENGINGVAKTLSSDSARIYQGRPVARANDTEFVLAFKDDKTLEVTARGPNGRITTRGIALNPFGAAAGVDFGETRTLSKLLLPDSNSIRKVMSGAASSDQIDGIFCSNGQAWSCDPSNTRLYYKVNGFSEAKANAAFLAGLTSLADIDAACLALRQSEGRLSEDFVIAYAKAKQSWLHVQGGLGYAEALEALGYRPESILDAYRYGLSVQDMQVYASWEKQRPDKVRVVDFALALYAESKPYLMVHAKPVEFLNLYDERLLASLMDALHLPDWDRARIFHGVAANATSAQLGSLAVLIGSSYASNEQKKRDLEGWLVQAMGGSLERQASFMPDSQQAERAAFLKSVLIYKGFLPRRAAVLSTMMALSEVLDYEIVESLLNAGVEDTGQLGKLARAGVDGGDLVEANSQRLQYETGNRGALIRISTSLPLLQRTPSASDTYLALEYLGIGPNGQVLKLGEDLQQANKEMEARGWTQLIHPGPVLSLGGSVPSTSNTQDGLVWMWQQGYLVHGLSHADSTETGFGRSTVRNLLDGSEYSGEAFSWRGANATEAATETRQEGGKSVEKSVVRIKDLSLAQTDSTSSEIVAIRFDMKHKIALSSLTLKTSYNPADTTQLDTTRNGAYIVEALGVDNAWVKVSKQDLQWTATPGEKVGDRALMTVALDTGGIPYQTYRIRGISGSYDRDRWIDEVEFTTAPIELLQAPSDLPEWAASIGDGPDSRSTEFETGPSRTAPASDWSADKLFDDIAAFDPEAGVDLGIPQREKSAVKPAMLAPPMADNFVLQ
ncbi:C80 family cysteine peptidase [Lysobacter antibioticus]|uniref:C80 family cysteine peptidase n=1 Tax=Lysobacter antibioticus TaxID=84531 RepID=UPI0009EB8719|nr:C80 family cysteine peptidase [Lysobacter antibioticus]